MKFSLQKTLPQRLFAAALVVLAAGSANAMVFTVGMPVGAGACTHGTIQSAIDAAEASAGVDTVRLTRSLTYEPEANTVNTSQELTIEGGYANCTAAADATNTVVSGNGGVTEPVFRITANTGAIVHLRRLAIRGGDEDGSGKGGGIYFRGGGIVVVSDSLITENTAGYGGGIYAEGTDSATELVIGANVVISNNTARYSGGGVVVDGVEMSMLDPGSILLGNEALGTGGTGGYGGGLHIYSGNRASHAYLGSGSPPFGALYGNSGVYGGGVALNGANTAQFQFYTTTTQQASISFNTATAAGGAIYIGSPASDARLWNVVVDNNLAPTGAAAYVGNSAGFYFNFGSKPVSAVNCTLGKDCGRITNNTATAGAVVYGGDSAALQFGYLPSTELSDARGGVLIQDNDGVSVIGGAGDTQLHRTLLSANTSSSDLVSQTSGALYIWDSTIGGNTIGGGSAILRGVNSVIDLRRSILWQPTITTLSRSGGSVSVDYVDATETSGIASPTTYSFEPRFIDPPHGDFRLRAGSRAVDFLYVTTYIDRDAYGQPREIDLPSNPNVRGSRDMGAFERQAVQPLVLNADFNFSDLRLWTKLQGVWDGTQNVTPDAGSGSWKYSTTAAPAERVEIGSQCIHLPGPGRYQLNGRGRTVGNLVATRDYAVLAWELRHAGGENCSGNAQNSGELRVGSSTSWGSAPAPALIDVSPAQFSSTSSITIRLIGDDGIAGDPTPEINVWFDDITLDYFSDVIFANGFQ